MPEMHHLLTEYGYVAIAILVAAESLGVPLPGETALLAGAALASEGQLSLPWVIISAAVGVAVGGCGGYWIGRTGGHAAVGRFGRWFGIKDRELDTARAFFERHGAAAVAIGRFLPVIRILTGLVAGITQMPFWRFAVVNTAAGVVWATIFGVLGYVFGHDVVRLQQRYGPVVGITLLCLAILAFLVFKWHERSITGLLEKHAGAGPDERPKPGDASQSLPK
jgi:membrane protein DedA with SNARE-associated domain